MNWNDLTFAEVRDKAKALAMEVKPGLWLQPTPMCWDATEAIAGWPTCGCPLAILAMHKRIEQRGLTPVNRRLVAEWVRDSCGTGRQEAITEILGCTVVETDDFTFNFDRTVNSNADEDVAAMTDAGHAGKRLALSMLGILPADAKGGF